MHRIAAQGTDRRAVAYILRPLLPSISVYLIGYVVRAPAKQYDHYIRQPSLWLARRPTQTLTSTQTRSNGQSCASLTRYVSAQFCSTFETLNMRSSIIWILPSISPASPAPLGPPRAQISKRCVRPQTKQNRAQ